MTDECLFSSSEENLPSSEELRHLFPLNLNIPLLSLEDVHLGLLNQTSPGPSVPEEDLYPGQGSSAIPETACIPSSSLPGIESWPGDYTFRVIFPQRETLKGSFWCYSELRNKLYIKRYFPLAFNFYTCGRVPKDACIRATAYYSTPGNASDVVARCINHLKEETEKGVPEAEHLVRCESNKAFYNQDQYSKTLSVVVPFEKPPVGQSFSSYVYKFACLTSCPGGPNRRPMMLVFTLEIGNTVIGRQKVNLKVCACPVRDMQQDAPLIPKPGVKRKISVKDMKSATKKALKKETVGNFNITVNDKKCYEFLKQMKKCYYMLSTVKGFNPEKGIDPGLLKLCFTSSDEVSNDERGS